MGGWIGRTSGWGALGKKKISVPTGERTRFPKTHIIVFEIPLSFNFLMKHDVSESTSASVFGKEITYTGESL